MKHVLVDFDTTRTLDIILKRVKRFAIVKKKQKYELWGTKKVDTFHGVVASFLRERNCSGHPYRRPGSMGYTTISQEMLKSTRIATYSGFYDQKVSKACHCKEE